MIQDDPKPKPFPALVFAVGITLLAFAGFGFGLPIGDMLHASGILNVRDVPWHDVVYYFKGDTLSPMLQYGGFIYFFLWPLMIIAVAGIVALVRGPRMKKRFPLTSPYVWGAGLIGAYPGGAFVGIIFA